MWALRRVDSRECRMSGACAMGHSVGDGWATVLTMGHGVGDVFSKPFVGMSDGRFNRMK